MDEHQALIQYDPTQIQDIETWVLFLIDESGSMRFLRDPVVKSLNETLNDLRVSMSEANITCRASVVTFANQITCRIPFTLLSNGLEMADYRPSGQTPLWYTIDQSLSALINVQEKLKAIGKNIHIAIHLLSDGLEETNYSNILFQRIHDTAHGPYPERCHANVTAAEDRGYLLVAHGIGVEKEKLCEATGFPLEHAITVEHSARGLDRSTRHTSAITMQWTERGYYRHPSSDDQK